MPCTPVLLPDETQILNKVTDNGVRQLYDTQPKWEVLDSANNYEHDFKVLLPAGPLIF